MDLPLRPNCRECGVGIGEFHLPGCLHEDCPYCGMPLRECEHCEEDDGIPLDDALPWRGLREMERAAHELGFYAVPYGEKGWTPCPKGTKGAFPDVERVIAKCKWDRRNKKFKVRK
jgi:hypothetical protein